MDRKAAVPQRMSCFLCIGYVLLTGESEHWTSQLDTTVTKGESEQGAYIISYNKDSWGNVRNFEISINNGQIIRQEIGLASASIQFPIMRTEGSKVSDEDDQTVEIKWTDVNGEKYEESKLLQAK
ncbi:hypothetical protein HNR77_004504 [Paenibacillus sp. JGP012]|uniref:hypothetical protein n=1 Tax=Paenibacillus sp. JGP012 TaxID=2735914 RepID=UPI0016086E1F|nr:hypothetical protein [Paenibacillus sp. JGP012]MBB6023404.1 hypothetical protein [Paenibacillus sp. JGP012]